MADARIKLKRVYDDREPDDGTRVLVERLWPRGVSRATAQIDHWYKDLAPSSELRRWYDHLPERWPDFAERYRDELNAIDPSTMEPLVDLCRSGPVTFIIAARERDRNSAVILRSFVMARL